MSEYSAHGYSMLPTCSGSPGVSLSLACIASTSSCTRSIDLKYLTVLTLSSAVASSSATISAQGCVCSAESVHYRPVSASSAQRIPCATHQVVDAALDGLAERERLALAGDDDDDLAGVKHCLDADGEGHAGHLGDIVSEEARVGEDGVVRERLDARARLERRAGLVERDVPVLADAAEKELDAAVRLDPRLVGVALADQILCVPVQDVDL